MADQSKSGLLVSRLLLSVSIVAAIATDNRFVRKVGQYKGGFSFVTYTRIPAAVAVMENTGSR